MKTKIEIPEFEYEFENYWFYRNGGYKVDKRTRDGKALINDIKKMDADRFERIGYEHDLHPALVCTSIKTRRALFIFKNLN